MIKEANDILVNDYNNINSYARDLEFIEIVKKRHLNCLVYQKKEEIKGCKLESLL